MRIDELDSIWMTTETKQLHSGNVMQQLIYPELLYRAYIGVTGIPTHRFLAIEIPEEQKDDFDSFVVPQGFNLLIDEPVVKHKGYVSCVLESSTHDLNDVFTILTKDILDTLSCVKLPEDYITVLKGRILKWHDFFAYPSNKLLSDKAVIGLIGELLFIKYLHENEIYSGADCWNGPIRSAQDFQNELFCAEIKSTASNELNFVHISSEMQLDANGKTLYLVVFRFSRDDTKGKSLPQYILEVSELLTEAQKNRFYANLLCLGYSEADADEYKKSYSIEELKVYEVVDGFPKILNSDLPKGISDITYKLYLKDCSNYETSLDCLIDRIKEVEHG